MSKHLGDYDASAVIYGKFTTYRPSTGAAFTLGGTPALSVYKDNSTTQSTTGVTLTVDFDSVTGLHHFAIDTSADGTFYSAGSFFDIVITTGTVDSISVVGSAIASFTIRKDSALKPATAGRTLVVDASGLADANAVKLGPSGSGTAQTARDLGTSVLLSSGTGTGQITLSSGKVALTTAEHTQVAADVLDATASGHNTSGTIGEKINTAGSATNPLLVRSGTAQAGGSTTITLDSGASATDNLYQNEVVFITSGTGAGQANIISSYVGSTKVATVTTAWAVNPDNTSVFSLLAVGPTVATVSGTVTANVTKWNGTTVATPATAGIPDVNVKNFNNQTAQTDASNLPKVDVENWKGAAAAAMTGDAYARLGAPAGASVSADVAAVKSDSAAIKAKTDNLPASPAATSDVPTATQNADALLKRDMSAVSGEALRSPLNALRLSGINKIVASSTTLTVYKENDSTTAFTRTLATDPAASPIVSSTP